METMHEMISVDLVKASENLTDQEKRVKRSASYYHRNKDKLWAVAELFKGKIEVQSATVEENCFDLNVAGDKHVLQAVFGIFRKLGYEPSSRPSEDPATTFSCYWEHDEYETKFWLYFTSTVCTRVKVGTEMVQRDIYETVCD